jgi:methyl-accepting chemotaxis protein
MKGTWRRRNYFIKKDLQGRYIFSFFIFVIAGSIIFTLIFSLLSSNTLTIIYENSNLKIGKTPLVLIKEMLRAYWIFIATAGLAVVIISMFFTHRFAGPIYRFEKSIEEMTRGNFNFEIWLRKKDEGKELAQMMNQLIDMVSSNFREMRLVADEISGKLTSAHKSINQIEEGKEAALELDKATALSSKLSEMLHSFKIKNDE